ncbi:MAG: FlgD immunoglobulin-like domain containing protein, partial [Desulfobacteraceae bacterium]
MSRVIQSERLNLSLLAAAVLAAVAAPAPSHAWNDLQVPETDAGVFDPREGPVLVDYRLLMDADELEVLVVDFSGRVIERMSFVELRAGDHEFEWGGCDENGEMLPNGRYRLEIRAVFEDGHTEKEDVEVRIASIPEKRLMPPPEPLPREEPFYRIDGTLSTFWRRNSEDPENVDESGEHRAWTRLRLKGEGHRVEGIFSMRRPYSGRASYEGSSAMAEKSWEEGRIKGVFRQGLGGIDDPMKLFSDFRTERKKVGGRLDHRLGRLDTTILGFTAEGDVENRERGGALRIGLDAARGIRMGLTLTGRSRGQERGRQSERDRAAAIDLAVPVGEGTDIDMEAVGTKNAENIRDNGWMLGVKHDNGTLRASAGYYYLGEDFSAPFADPLRRVYS